MFSEVQGAPQQGLKKQNSVKSVRPHLRTTPAGRSDLQNQQFQPQHGEDPAENAEGPSHPRRRFHGAKTPKIRKMWLTGFNVISVRLPPLVQHGVLFPFSRGHSPLPPPAQFTTRHVGHSGQEGSQTRVALLGWDLCRMKLP